jgi:murein DD-endopeptidase MepM/ murein hydrolase activator NlpD
MRQFYYFSKKKLKFVEIRNFQKKLVFLTIFFSLIISFLIFSTYIVINEIVNPNAQVESLQAQNMQLRNELNSMLGNYKSLNQELDSLFNVNNKLRLAVNLPPLNEEDRDIGVGGNIFEKIRPRSNEDIEKTLDNLDNYIKNVESKVSFTKHNYNEISRTLKLNKKLYASIPAIRPMDGWIGDTFGMRNHPILNTRKMHNGLDIVNDVNTKVYAPGAGKIASYRYRGGYGWTLEIDHGFGYKTLYAHLRKAKVKVGEKVGRGDLIALSGNSGKLSTGPHLHYEIRHDGVALNPSNFMFDDVQLFDVVNKN